MSWVFTDEMRFYLHANETLLEGMQRTEHTDLRYECREGYCGACRMRVVAKTGDIHYKNPPIAMLEPDEVLACCCVPTGVLQVSYHAADTHQLKLFPQLDNADKS